MSIFRNIQHFTDCKISETRINLRPLFYLCIQGMSFTIPDFYIELLGFGFYFLTSHDGWIIEFTNRKSRTIYSKEIGKSKPH